MAHILLASAFLYGKENDNLTGASSATTSSTVKVTILYPRTNTKPISVNPVEATKKKSEIPSLAQQAATEGRESESPFHILKISKPHYYSSKELTEKALVLRDIPPDLGVLLHDVPTEKIAVWLYINEIGNIDQVFFENPTLPKEAESLIHEHFAKLKFYPGKIDGIAVKSKLKIEILIEAQSGAATNSNRSLIR